MPFGIRNMLDILSSYSKTIHNFLYYIMRNKAQNAQGKYTSLAVVIVKRVVIEYDIVVLLISRTLFLPKIIQWHVLKLVWFINGAVQIFLPSLSLVILFMANSVVLRQLFLQHLCKSGCFNALLHWRIILFDMSLASVVFPRF
jgi:hypothetical protein